LVSEKLQKLLGKGKKVKIGEVEIEIKPLKIADLDLWVGLSDPKEQGKVLKNLTLKTLKDAFPEDSEEDISQISMEYFEEISKAIIEVNGLKKNME